MIERCPVLEMDRTNQAHVACVPYARRVVPWESCRVSFSIVRSGDKPPIKHPLTVNDRGVQQEHCTAGESYGCRGTISAANVVLAVITNGDDESADTLMVLDRPQFLLHKFSHSRR